MTVIAAVAFDGATVMACDTRTVDTWDMKGTLGTKIVRVATAQGDALLGVSGDAQVLPLVQHCLDLPEVIDDLDRWAYDVARVLTALMVDAKPPLMEGNRQTAGVLLGFQGRLWSLATNQAWSQPLFFAIGSGDNYAMGALHVLARTGDLRANPKSAALIAVEAASKFDLHYGGCPVLEVA